MEVEVEPVRKGHGGLVLVHDTGLDLSGGDGAEEAGRVRRLRQARDSPRPRPHDLDPLG